MAKVRFGIALSTLVMVMTVTTLAHAHEIMPAVANIEQQDGRLVFEVETNIEALLTGADLSEVTNSDEFERVDTYEILRVLPALALQSQFEASWSALAGQMSVLVDGTPAPLTLVNTAIADQPDLELPRVSVVTFAAELPDGAAEFQFSWAKTMGTIIVRQNGVEDGYTGQLEAGAMTDPIKLAGGSALSWWQTFVFYIPVGFEHIVPLGLDHILFVLGLFFLSTQLRPLLIQVSAFTVAHTITLALAALGYVTVPGSIVEPLIALLSCSLPLKTSSSNRLARGDLLSFSALACCTGWALPRFWAITDCQTAHSLPRLSALTSGSRSDSCLSSPLPLLWSAIGSAKKNGTAA